MTESEWLASGDPETMLQFVLPHHIRDHVGGQLTDFKIGDRKLRLFACALCRFVWPLLTDPRSRLGVEVAEAFADRNTTIDAFVDAKEMAYRAVPNGPAFSIADCVGLAMCSDWQQGMHQRSVCFDGHVAVAMQAATLRDIIGNPFAPLPHLLRPLSLTIDSLARGAYEERQSDGTLDALRLCILADALDDLGSYWCGAEILEHLRSPGTHWRGCWAVDRVLGKS